MDGEGRHERGTGERDEFEVRWRDEERRRHGFTERDTLPAVTPLEHAILTDDDDPLAAASGTMRDPGDAPAVVRAAEQDASLGNLRIPGAPGGFDMPGAAEEAKMDRQMAAELRRAEQGYPWSGDPGDEHDPHHVETVRRAVIRDDEGAVLRHHDPRLASVLADGEHLTHEDWPAAQVAADENDVRPTVYAPYGTLTDDALERLEELGIQVEEIDPAEPDTLDGPDLHTDQEWGELAVADTAADGTVRELRLLEGGAVDLTPRRKVQVWIDLRFQYVSDHPYGAPDTLEEERLRTIGAFVEQFGNMTVGNNFEAIEGMAIQSVVGHILDKPGDPFPAAS